LAGRRRGYAKDCAKFGKRPFETAGEVIVLNGLRAVALFRGDRLAAAYRVVEQTLDNLAGTDLIRLRGLLARRNAQSED
jgi:hypothetical protein